MELNKVAAVEAKNRSYFYKDEAGVMAQTFNPSTREMDPEELGI